MVDVERLLKENAQLKTRLARFENLETELCAVREDRDIFRRDLARNRLHVARLTNLVEAKDTKLKDLERQLEWITKQKQQTRSQREMIRRTPNIHAIHPTSSVLGRSATALYMEDSSKVYEVRPNKRALGTFDQNVPASDFRPEKRIKVEPPEERLIIEKKDGVGVSKLSWDHEANKRAPSVAFSTGSPNGHDADKSSSEDENLPTDECHTSEQTSESRSDAPIIPMEELASARQASFDPELRGPETHIRQYSSSTVSIAGSDRTENTIMPTKNTVPLSQSKITRWTLGTRPISPPPSVAEAVSLSEAFPRTVPETKPRTEMKQEQATRDRPSKSEVPRRSRRRVAKSLFERPPDTPSTLLPDEDVLDIVRRANAVPTIDPAPSELLVSRQLVRQWYGREGDDGVFMESSRLGPFLFINPENSLSLPQKPGQPATVIISGKTPTNPLVTLFFCAGTDDQWMLGGMYRLSTRKMLPDEFKKQSDQFKANFVQDMFKGKTLSLASGPLNSEFTTTADLIKAFESGEETLLLGSLTFFMYSHAFARDMESRFHRTQAIESVP